MKKFLVGLLVIGSISALARDSFECAQVDTNLIRVENYDMGKTSLFEVCGEIKKYSDESIRVINPSLKIYKREVKHDKIIDILKPSRSNKRIICDSFGYKSFSKSKSIWYRTHFNIKKGLYSSSHDISFNRILTSVDCLN